MPEFLALPGTVILAARKCCMSSVRCPQVSDRRAIFIDSWYLTAILISTREGSFLETRRTITRDNLRRRVLYEKHSTEDLNPASTSRSFCQSKGIFSESCTWRDATRWLATSFKFNVLTFDASPNTSLVAKVESLWSVVVSEDGLVQGSS